MRAENITGVKTENITSMKAENITGTKMENITDMKMQDFKIRRLKKALDEADAVVVGAGAGLSTAAGFTYSGERFERYFHDFGEKYGFSDMYSGGFYPYKAPEEYWAYWSRYIYVNRYMDPPKNTYDILFNLVKDKDYFVITTNVDHCFQKSGFDRKRLFYTQGDYGLLQCSVPCRSETFDNEEIIKEMVSAQGFVAGKTLEGEAKKMTVPAELVPVCPHCGKPLTTNLREDDKFVEDEGWHLASERYSEFLRRHDGLKILFLELGVGFNTPVIIKYPFLQMTAKNPNATYACVNLGQTATLPEIAGRSICVDADISDVLISLQTD